MTWFSGLHKTNAPSHSKHAIIQGFLRDWHLRSPRVRRESESFKDHHRQFVDHSDFIVAFAIGCSERNRIDGNFGWVRLAYEGGAIVLKGGAINTTQGSPLVARGFNGVDDGPDEPVEGLIWRCNFNSGVQWMEIADMPEVASHTLLVGDEFEALIDDGRYSGRLCAEIGGGDGERAWFSVNERVDGRLGPRYVPAKWQTLKTSFKMYSTRAWEEQEGGLYAEMPPSLEEEVARV